MKKVLLNVVALMFLSVSVWAQKKITGKVTDENGAPISGASVIVKGTSVGTTTDANGNYSITAPEGSKALVISYVGQQNKEITIGSSVQYNVSLLKAQSEIDDVLVVGYGRKSVRENTGAVSKIDGARIAATPLPSFDQALSGKTAGVAITAAGGLLGDGMAIRIRGINSISTSSQPLVVIDGIPQVAVTNLNGFNSGDGTRFNPLALVNPNDIESLEVLKDAGAAAIYGSRAANGVILITTKKGQKGTGKVSLDAKLGFGKATKLPELLNGDQFIALNNEKAVNRYGAGTSVAKESDLNGDGVNDRTDWMDLLYRQAKTQDYTISASGGSEKAQFYGSARYSDQDGISINNRLRTGQIRLSGDVTPNKWFKAGFGASYTKSLNQGVLSNFYTAGSTIAWQAPPTLSPYNPNGPLGYSLTTVAPIGVLAWGNNVRNATTGNFQFFHPLNSNWNVNENTAEDLRGHAYAEIQPIKGLRITTKYGVQYLTNYEHQYTPPFQAGLGNPYNGLVQDQTQYRALWDWQNILSYEKAFGSHKVSFVGGSEYQKNNYRYNYLGAANFSDPFFKNIIDNAYTNVQPGTTGVLNLTGGDMTSSGVESYFGRLGYSFANKYFIEGSFRRDAFSGFGIDSRWGNFPSVSVGWEITQEKFMQGLTFLNYAKLRGSYGKVGNSAGVGAYSSRTLYSGAAYTILTGLGNSQAGNSNLRWESSDKINVGLEANFLDSRIGFVFDYFENDINDLILAAPTLYTVGVPGSSITTNIGGMYNKGIELTINATPVKTKDFEWTTSFNYTVIKNKVTGLVAANGNADITSANSVASVGKSLGTYFLYEWAGVDPATGNPQWYAANGTIKRYNFGAPAATLWTDDKGTPVSALGAADLKYIDKVGLPKWYGGWDNNFRYRNLSLSMSFFYQGGNYIYNGTKAVMLSNNFLNNSTEILNRWQKAGDVTDVARLFMLDNTANTASTRFLEKGDFLRCRTMALAYDLPRNILGRAGLDAVQFSVTLLNPFTFTNYSGADPEVNTNRFSNIAVGYDTRSIPQTRSVVVGLRANF
ncbi:SusC/RagA family TonB-linked outer membrane protein [Polluticaenibacter yanchengensis]|uniref:TonB-dependent receptor n=1 Tax=Polluticaenibacter yanchengensis TaxID=3014562 RepID=A0ABT4UGT7_9BACT|nr:TonB-dependent receptor [Chitinophagaceae bacterium LY-5]